MAIDEDISALVELAVEPAANDELVVEDVSIPATKKILWTTLKAALLENIPPINTAEIDFGTTAVLSKKFTVTDAAIVPGHLIIVSESAATPTGKMADEHEFDALALKAVAGTGQFTLYAQALCGPVSGKFRINYTFEA